MCNFFQSFCGRYFKYVGFKNIGQYKYIFQITVKSRVEFNNAICIGIDRSVLDFDQCILKAVNRTYKYFSLRAKFPRREPYNNISVCIIHLIFRFYLVYFLSLIFILYQLTFALLRKANGYKPFLYNFTIDVCKYLTKRSNPVVRYFHNWFENYSTLNRTCPYGTVSLSIFNSNTCRIKANKLHFVLAR